MILIVLNAAANTAKTSVPGHTMALVDSEGQPLLRKGDRLERIELGCLSPETDRSQTITIDWNRQRPSVVIEVGAESFNLFRVLR
jgi:hypothetical protein